MLAQKLMLMLALISVVGCTSTNNNNNPAPTTPSSAMSSSNSKRPSISDDQYTLLLALDDDALAEQAKQGKLGNCQLETIEANFYMCTNDAHTAVKLVNENVYFPDMSEDKPFSNPHEQYPVYCRHGSSKDLRQALKEGFCFNKQLPLENISDDGIARKALIGEFGKCTAEIIPNESCSEGRVFPRYKIKTNGKFDEETDLGWACFQDIGQRLRTLSKSGQCF